jgi:hypothetical protein
VAGNITPEQLEELEQKFGFKFRPSASQPDNDPQPYKVAKGKSLTGAKSRLIRTPGTTSAQKTSPSNPNRDKSGYRQVTRYRANKVATESLTTSTTDDPELLAQPDSEEIRDRLTNPNNKQFQHNPPVIKGQVLK